MESFSLLKYWRGGGGGSTIAAAIRSSTAIPAAAAATTVTTAVLRPSSATTDGGGGDDDEGPFFDLEFTTVTVDNGSAAESDGEVEEGEFNFELSSVGSGGAGGGGGGGDGLRSESFSPPDDLLFRGKFVPMKPSSVVIEASDPDNKPHFLAVSLLKSATKFRIFLLGLRKPKPTSTEPNAAAAVVETASPKPQQPQSRFFVKFKVEEVPIVSLVTRDNSSRNTSSGVRAAKPPADDSVAGALYSAEEKRFAREVVQKYLNMIKPLYVRVSRRHSERLRRPGEPAPAKAVPIESEPEEAAASAVAIGAGGKVLPGRLRAVGKRLGKSRSASAAVAAVPSPSPQRQDDSLREVQDGIQSAIAHCKRSFTAPDKGSESPLVRSKSGPIRAMDDQS